jgi:DNA-binding transcriptional LysR family regulator
LFKLFNHPMALKNLLRRLDLTTLQLFLAVYEEGTLTRAAEREAIAVSAASKRLLELEQAVGATLFVRRARGMELTPAGETLLHHARRVLRDVENIGIELAEHATGVRGFVRMMANLSAIVEFLPEDLRAFFSMNERIKLDLEERPSSGVVQGIADSLADVGICSGEADTRGLDVSHYRHDSLVVVMREDHALADREQVTFVETLDSDYVGLHAASSINLRTQTAARQAGKPLRLHSGARFRWRLPHGADGSGHQRAAAEGLQYSRPSTRADSRYARRNLEPARPDRRGTRCCGAPAG